MKINYKKLWILLAEKEICKSEFKNLLGFSSTTMAKLNKNQNVALSVLLRICDHFDCNVCDICDATHSK